MLLANGLILDKVSYFHVHAWPPIGFTQGAKQFVLPAVPQRVMSVYQQLCPDHECWDVYPTLRRGGQGWEKDVKLITALPIHLPQLPNSVSLIHILEQPAPPEVVIKSQSRVM